MFGKAKEQYEMAKQAMAIQKMIKSVVTTGKYGAIELSLGVSLEKSGASIKVIDIKVNKEELQSPEKEIKEAIEAGSRELIRKLIVELQNSGLSLPGM